MYHVIYTVLRLCCESHNIICSTAHTTVGYGKMCWSKHFS